MAAGRQAGRRFYETNDDHLFTLIIIIIPFCFRDDIDITIINNNAQQQSGKHSPQAAMKTVAQPQILQLLYASANTVQFLLCCYFTVKLANCPSIDWYSPRFFKTV